MAALKVDILSNDCQVLGLYTTLVLDMTKTLSKISNFRFVILVKLIFLLVSLMVTSFLHAQPLPYLNTFSATEANGKVYLNWVIASGNTCDGVRVFRSADGINFDQIGEISGICGSPYSAVSYEFWDTLPLLNTTSYYKLELGNLGFSLVESLKVFDFSVKNYQIIPHPFARGGTIAFENPSFEIARIRIFNLNGRLMWEDEQNGREFQISAGSLKAGLYLFEIVLSGKIVKARGRLLVIGQ
ncbi:MAG: hypothetical protein PWQ54_1674 [Bacteroidales bacterium]|nr:hypothetical protein [Bacteroidales bacterium]